MGNAKSLRTYISNLPVGGGGAGVLGSSAALEDLAAETPGAVDVDSLPDGVVSGGNLIQFSKETSPKARAATALSLLAAQRVAANDPVVASPDQWMERHHLVLTNLNWLVETSGYVGQTFDDVGVAVHEAIIPFLTTAFGGAATAATLILKALEQLKAMNEEKDPWIKLWSRESRRFEVSEYQFSYVEADGADTVLRLAAARLDAKFGKTQVLFFKVKSDTVAFDAATSTLRGSAELLDAIREPLRDKLATQLPLYIANLPT